MTQDDLMDYIQLPEHSCSVFKEKEKDDGTYYWIRRKDDRSSMTIVHPVKSGILAPSTVYLKCKDLKIPIHRYGKPAKSNIEKMMNYLADFKKTLGK